MNQALSETHLERTVDRSTDQAFRLYQQYRSQFWDEQPFDPISASSRAYSRQIAETYRFLVPPGQRIIELGCGAGDLLAALEPSRGLGVDFSHVRVEEACSRHPDLEFRIGDVHDLSLEEDFDVIILSDLVNDLWDVQAVLEQVRNICNPGTRLILNFYNRVWQLPLNIARSAGKARRVLQQNWLSVDDVENLLNLEGFDIVNQYDEILLPSPLGPVARFANKIAVRLPLLKHGALTTFLVARVPQRPGSELSVSVVVPARNEAGNIEAIIDRTPQMGAVTELIFVEGNSTDDTYEVLQQAVAKPGRDWVKLLQQPGKGKGDAVRHGFDNATGDVLMILDADMTVAPEELPRFYEAIADGSAEFVNGVRLVYPMQGEAMRPLNLLGNKAFSIIFSWLLQQPVKDTLCGTKVLTRQSYNTIVSNRSYFGDFDPFGDFDLLFGAAKANLSIVDIPIRYRDRTYGDTNIDRWRDGLLLLKMAAYAARKLRFR